MSNESLFVGAVSIALGVGGLVAAIGNSEACYQLAKVRWFESVAGRQSARAAYGLIGLLLIGLGIAIACGVIPERSNARKNRLNAESLFGTPKQAPEPAS